MVELSKSTNVVTEPYYRRWGRGGVCVWGRAAGGSVERFSTQFTLLEKVLRVGCSRYNALVLLH